jgi:hypothetical protein
MITEASVSELTHLARTAMERLMNPNEVLSPAEREALMAARVGAVGELSRREESTKAERKASADAARAAEIRRELAQHQAAAAGDGEDAARERKLRAPRVAQLSHEISQLEAGM